MTESRAFGRGRLCRAAGSEGEAIAVIESLRSALRGWGEVGASGWNTNRKAQLPANWAVKSLTGDPHGLFTSPEKSHSVPVKIVSWSAGASLEIGSG